MSYSINLGSWNDIFAVPKDVVNKYIKLAKEDYIKVLLVLLANAGNELSTSELSTARPLFSKRGLPMARLWMTFCLKPLPPQEKRLGVCWV